MPGQTNLSVVNKCNLSYVHSYKNVFFVYGMATLLAWCMRLEASVQHSQEIV